MKKAKIKHTQLPDGILTEVVLPDDLKKALEEAEKMNEGKPLKGVNYQYGFGLVGKKTIT